MSYSLKRRKWNNKMSIEKRIELIKQIEDFQRSKVICYVTGDRAPFTTQIADDAIRVIRRHLDSIGINKRISLFLYSRGGDMVAPLRIVRLIREHCEVFNVLIPYRAHSAATSIALGADEIVMGKSGELSPVDPTTVHPFNPQDPNNPQQRIPISVEDVTSYLFLAKEKAGIRDEQMVSVFNELANKINPLALGNIYRTYRMARSLTEKLLGLHMDIHKEKNKIETIVQNLTEKLCIHGYLISRTEAEKEIGLNIIKPDEKLETLMWALYEGYEEEMKLNQPFVPLEILKDEGVKTFSYYGSYIESAYGSDGFLFKAEIKRIEPAPGQIQATVNIKPIGWCRIN
ncbi:MAG: hypothetical protein AB1488_06010 [Nitrospirota bacterium]